MLILDHKLVSQNIVTDLVDKALVDCLALAVDSAKEFLNRVERLCHILDAHLEHHRCLDRFFECLSGL